MKTQEPIITPPTNGEFKRRTGICLNMIVKDETPVIGRVLGSVKGVIDYYVIVDTGSSDGTPELIQRLMQEAGIPGEIHFRKWVNYGHNRHQALELAVAAGHGDWLMFIDADEELASRNANWYQQMQPATTYQLAKHHDNLRYALNNLIWIRDVNWTWHGVVHEYVQADREHPRAQISDAWIIYHAGEGVRSRGVSQQDKFFRDAAMLEAELRKNPKDARSLFYLAQSYRDASQPAKAFKYYDQRVLVGGWIEETYVAQCQKAQLSIQLNHEHNAIIAEHLKAYSLRPSRAEALWQLANYCRERNRFAEGYLFAKVGKSIPMTQDVLFVRRDVYEWRLLDEFSVCAYWIGEYQECADACLRILSEGFYDPTQKSRIQGNLRFALNKLEEA